MTLRAPSPCIVVDANIPVSAVPGRTGRAAIAETAAPRALLTREDAERETRRRVPDPSLYDSRHGPFPHVLCRSVRPLARPSYALLMPEAARTPSPVPASANGSEAVAHLLAVVWIADADVWTHDRDLAGTGWPTRNLRAALPA